MAQRIRLLDANRRPIVLQEPESAEDTFIRNLTETLGRLTSPELAMMKRREERADANLALERRRQDEAEELQNEEINIARNRERREKALFDRQLKQEGDAKFLNDFGLIYDEENRGTRQGIDNARAWLAGSTNLDANMYNVIETKLKQDEAMLNKRNQDTDNIGNLISSMNPDFQYDSSEPMRQMIRNTGDFMLQNTVSQKYLGAMSPQMQVMYKQDLESMTELVKQAFLNPDVSAQNQFAETVVAPATNLWF